jgi:hypothetical protein
VFACVVGFVCNAHNCGAVWLPPGQQLTLLKMCVVTQPDQLSGQFPFCAHHNLRGTDDAQVSVTMVGTQGIQKFSVALESRAGLPDMGSLDHLPATLLIAPGAQMGALSPSSVQHDPLGPWFRERERTPVDGHH